MIINVGSINIDHVYRVRHLPKAGETISATSCQQFLGGKGINQSIAISKSGGDLIHVGSVGTDGGWALSEIEKLGVDTGSIRRTDNTTGHAVICVDDAGENQIVIYSGANLDIDIAQVEQLFTDHADGNNWALIQNETNATLEIAELARKSGLKLAYSAAPFDAERIPDMIDRCDLLVVNEIEAAETCSLLGKELAQLPVGGILVTKGKEGSLYHQGGTVLKQEAFEVEAVDTTGAGDTFLGAFLARLDLGEPPQDALRFASAASALQVTMPGAAAAIPGSDATIEFMKKAGG